MCSSDLGAYPEIPARGVTDRNNLFFTQIVGGFCLVILLILVGDETILTWRFVSFLRQGRTVYPVETVHRFAAELGPDLAAKAAEPEPPGWALPKPAPLVPVPPRGKGPLIVEQMDATTVAPPGAKVFNDGRGYLHIELGSEASHGGDQGVVY